MKHLVRLLGLSLFSLFLIISSCNKDEIDPDGEDPNNPPQEEFQFGTITMKVDGNSWTSTPENNVAVVVNDQFFIQIGNDQSSTQVNLSPFPGEGNHQLEDSPQYSALHINMTSFASYFCNDEGEVSISDYNAPEHRLTGTFDLIGYVISDSSQTVTITDGAFTNIPMSFTKDQNASIITFSVNGEPWNGDNAGTTTVPSAYQMQVAVSESISSDDAILVFPYDLDPGSYSLSQDFTKQKFTYNGIGSESGSLTITVNDKQNHHIEGVFDANLNNTFTNETATISSGEFSFDY